MAIRAEESAWFDIAYLGSGGAFGLLDPACLAIARSDNGQSLEATLKQRGFDPQPIRARRRLLDPSGIRAYLELHIEQGPTLVARGLPAAVVSAYAAASAFAMHAASASMAIRAPSGVPTGATPSRPRSPFFTIWRASGCNKKRPARIWFLTSGSCSPTRHARAEQDRRWTRFVLDLRSLSDTTMEVVAAEHALRRSGISAAYRVRIDLGATSDSPAAVMDSRLRARLMSLLDRPFEMASGAGTTRPCSPRSASRTP